MDLCDPILLWFDKRKCLKNQKKIFSNEILFSQPIFVALGRELLAKFSIVTKIFKNFDLKIGAAAKKSGATGVFIKIRRRRPHYRFE